MRALESATADVFLATIAPLEPFVRDPAVTEIMVNGPDQVWVERAGALQRVDVTIAQESVRGAIVTLARLAQRDARENSSDAIVHGRFDDLRLAGVLAPTAQDGHALCIRKHTRSDLRLDDYAAAGAFGAQRDQAPPPASSAFLADGEVIEFFRQAVAARRTLLVSGSTGSGKTTFLNALIAEVQDTERLVTIEDTIELRVRAPNRVRLLSNAQAGITTRELLRLALRLRPDRIIVGEVRGAEAFDLLQALNTGHEGGFATLHANDARLALTRLESMVMLGVPSGGNWPLEAMRMQIASCIDYVVHLRRSGCRRYVSEIILVEGYRNGTYATERIF